MNEIMVIAIKPTKVNGMWDPWFKNYGCWIKIPKHLHTILPFDIKVLTEPQWKTFLLTTDL